MNIIAAMSSYEKQYMPEMEVQLRGLTGNEYSVETVTKYLDAAGKKEISFFANDWLKDLTMYIEYTGALPLYTTKGEYVGLLCVDIDVTEIQNVVMDETLLNVVLILLLGILFIGIFIFWTNRNIANPIHKLENSVTTFAYSHKGKDNVDSLVIEDPKIHTDNEVESLANAVVKMSKDMRSYVINVIEAEDKARTLSELANKDSLTNVRNKTAYDRYVEELNKKIIEGEVEFALAMIDLNNLKKINDNYGHEHGNDYIKKSCKAICNIFKHSAVFRIGGDEFVAVLMGSDYENRRAIYETALNRFSGREANPDLKPWEKLYAAIGLTDYSPETDYTLEDVFNRADKLMYENKSKMKG